MTRPLESERPAAEESRGGSLTVALREAAIGLDTERPGALESLWDLMADQLFGLALWRTGRREDADDVVQEVFVRLARFPSRLRGARDPRAYLLRIAHNAAIDLVKRRRPVEPLDAAVPFAICQDEAETAADAARVSRHLAELPPVQREALFLRFFAELSFREIGSITGVPTFTVATRCRLALRRLRIAMGVES